MKNKLKNAIEAENEQELIEWLDFRRSGNVDTEFYEHIEKALLGTWHSQHEDLVGKIYLENLIDDRFVEPILTIALNKERFRWYDDELEATLRKCIHALKTINSEKANRALYELKGLNNDNISTVLDMYI